MLYPKVINMSVSLCTKCNERAGFVQRGLDI